MDGQPPRLAVEYRYDALGRRVLVRTTRDGVCVGGGTDVDCTSGIERFVYAGDNVLWEMRGPGSASSTPAELGQAIGTGQEYGAIGYTHAGGVDRPLAAYKLGVNAAVIAPHTNWREEFSGGTYLQGSPSTAPVSWPGYSTTAWYQGQPPQEQNRVYMGTVLEGQRDASGQMYMRNRMYDPQTGQFTQTDPIGIAGGLNTYGFAEGDPVTYRDPSGLCASNQVGTDGKCPGGLTHTEYDLRADGFLVSQDRWAEYGSCRTYGCILRDPTEEERSFVLNRLLTIRTDIPFCREVMFTGLEMVSRQLAMFDNRAHITPDSILLGNAPMHARLGGPVMYLYAPRMRRYDGHTVVHEAIHGMLNPRWRIPTYYSDYSVTELGLSIDASARVCRRRS